jgi:hypothetical protein
MKYISLSILFFSTFFIPLHLYAQKSKLVGFVYDEKTKTPIAFVSITHDKTGVVTDIDGRFSITGNADSLVLQVSHVGYKAKQIIITVSTKLPLQIFIEPSGKDLENIVIAPGENPAHRIIRLLQQNKKKHDPKYVSSFEYNAYTVAALGSGEHFWNMNTAEEEPADKKKNKPSKDSINSEEEKRDSILFQRFRQNYLFLTKSYTKRIFRYPKQSRETILATKVTGIKSPSFAITTSNFQPFGFYDDYLQLGDKAYVNPIINGSIGMYKFKLLETRINSNDTTFIISFQPKKRTNFNGLKGTLYINSNEYAIENVTASAADEKGLLMRYKLQQKYENINGQWFPAQLNSTITQTDTKTDSAILYWDSRSYISNPVFNKQFFNKDFSDVETDYDAAAGKHTELEWNNYRTDSLKEKEKQTYQTYTMLPPKFLNTLEKGNRLIEIFALQAFTVGKVDIPLKYFLAGANKYESIRIGGGFQTNEFLNKIISFGGFAGYGAKDKAWKYGGNILFTLNKRTATSIQFNYSRDIIEPGNTDYFTRNGSVFSQQTLRNFFTSRMDSIKQYRLDFTSKIKPSLQANLWLLNEKRNPAKYNWQYKNDNTGKTYRSFINTEAGIGLRFVNGEKFTMLGRAKVISKPASTELMVQLSKGFNNFLNGNLSYTKLALQFNHSFRLKRLGQTSFQIEAGQVWGDIPYSYLFNTKASNTSASISLFIPNSFQTVGLYEFVADKTASLFVQHNFGSLLLKPKNPHIRPEFIIAQAICFGSLKNPGFQNGIEIKTATKGLYESGLLVNNIYRMNMQFFYLGLGAGLFYRYGHYSFPETIDNFEFKFGISLSF